MAKSIQRFPGKIRLFCQDSLMSCFLHQLFNNKKEIPHKSERNLNFLQVKKKRRLKQLSRLINFVLMRFVTRRDNQPLETKDFVN